MLAANGTDDQFDYGEWARDWGMDGYGIDGVDDDTGEEMPFWVGPQIDALNNRMEIPVGPVDVGRNENVMSGPNSENCVELGQSIIAKSKLLDLNRKLYSTTTGESRTWVPLENPSHSPNKTSSSPSINQADCESPVISANTVSSSTEIQATMEIGEKLGFQFHGNEEQVKSMLKNEVLTDDLNDCALD
ncbi:hypothetical protein L1887_31870 [Cichorium endivia]|nr:hypothetical protein L1887_31870 [Cichorium endivia]